MALGRRALLCRLSEIWDVHPAGEMLGGGSSKAAADSRVLWVPRGQLPPLLSVSIPREGVGMWSCSAGGVKKPGLCLTLCFCVPPPSQTGPVEDEPAGPGHGADSSGHPECRDSVPCGLEQNRPQHGREGRSVHVLRAEASRRGKALRARGLDCAGQGAGSREPSKGSPRRHSPA